MCDFSPAQKRPVHASHAAPAEQLGTSCSEISGGESTYITALETLNTAISHHSTRSSAQHCFQIGSFPLTHARYLVLLVACFQSVLESVLVQWAHRRALWRMTERMNRALAHTCVPHRLLTPREALKLCWFGVFCLHFSFVPDSYKFIQHDSECGSWSIDLFLVPSPFSRQDKKKCSLY